MAKDVLYHELAEFYEPLYRKSLYDAEKNIRDECDGLEQVFGEYGHRKVETVLDVGCGTGIHSLELARRGYCAVGFDIAPRMVEIASKRAGENAPATFFVGDMRDFSLEREFDAAICMTNAFLCNSTDEEAEKALACMGRALRPGGLLVLEVSNYLGQAAKGDFSRLSVDRAEKNGWEVMEISENEFDLPRGVLREKNTYFISKDGRFFQRFETSGTLGLFTAKRAEPLLEKTGLELSVVLDAENLEEAAADSYEYLVVATKI